MWLRVSLVGITLVVGLSLGVAALIGHYLGAFEIKMAKKTAKCSILFGISSMGILAFITIIWAKEITMLFFKDIDLIELGIEVLRIQALSLVFIGLSISLKGIFAGAGDNLPSMISCLISDWIVLIPFVLISIKLLHINQTGIWWALVVSKIINASIFYWWHKSGRWLKKKV
jgi:Na+-driven multidrug efflux pump